ncbi:collagen alpha-1(XV) chain, partial [Nephila pilipes]
FLMKGLTGPPGPPGPPGAPGSPGSFTGEDSKRNQPTVVPGAVTLKNVDSLLRVSEISPLGTLGFVLDEETLLVRVSGGWQYVALGSLVPLPSATTTTGKSHYSKTYLLVFYHENCTCPSHKLDKNHPLNTRNQCFIGLTMDNFILTYGTKASRDKDVVAAAAWVAKFKLDHVFDQSCCLYIPEYD